MGIRLDPRGGYADLREHVGHEIECVTYGDVLSPPVNVALECRTCEMVLLDFDRPGEPPAETTELPNPAGAWMQAKPGHRYHFITHYLPGHLDARPAHAVCGLWLDVTPASKVAVLITPEEACSRCSRAAR